MAVVAVHSAIAVAVAVAGMSLWDVTAAVAVAGHDEPCHVAAVPGILPQSSLHALQDVCERGKNGEQKRTFKRRMRNNKERN